MTLRVLHVITDTDRRGAQVFGAGLALRLDELGLANRVVALVAAPRRSLGSGLGARPRGVGTLRALRAAMTDADITVAHGAATLPRAAGWSRSGRPFVYRQVSDPVFWTPTALRRWRTRALYRLPTHVVSLSDRTAPVLAQRFAIDPRRITVIPNAVDDRIVRVRTAVTRASARAAFGITEEQQVLAYVGALVREKGVVDLVESVDPGSVLLLAGDGPAAAEIAEVGARRGVEVRLLGVVQVPSEVYAAADLFVLPSWSEQQPGVLIEAAMSGLASVATRVGVVDEVVLDGATGTLVPPKDGDALRCRDRGAARGSPPPGRDGAGSPRPRGGGVLADGSSPAVGDPAAPTPALSGRRPGVRRARCHPS